MPARFSDDPTSGLRGRFPDRLFDPLHREPGVEPPHAANHCTALLNQRSKTVLVPHPRIAPTWPKSVQLWPNSANLTGSPPQLGRHRQNIDRCPTFEESGRMSPNISRAPMADFCRTSGLYAQQRQGRAAGALCAVRARVESTTVLSGRSWSGRKPIAASR